MSLRQHVIEQILSRGSATVDDIHPALQEKHGYTREQVMRAMQAGCTKKELKCTGRRRIHGMKGAFPSIYTVTDRERERQAVLKQEARPLASVWELAVPREIVGIWPPPYYGDGLKHQLRDE